MTKTHSPSPRFKTTDLCDTHQGSATPIQIAKPGLLDFGGRKSFCGAIETLKLFEDNSLVRATLETPGNGRVLVIDGSGSLQCALLGDQLGALAVKNGWSGLIIHGCVRDTAELAGLDLGVKALAPHPRKSRKEGQGTRGGSVMFFGVTFTPGEFVYCDEDGVVVSHLDLFATPEAGSDA